MESKTVVLKTLVDAGEPGPEHFDIVSSIVDPTSLQDGEILVQALAMSVDPYLRGGIKTGGTRKVGVPMDGFISGKVLASKNPNFTAGDLFGASLPFSTVQIVNAASASCLIWKLTGLLSEDQISYGIGVLGMPGSTAYAGLIDVLKAKQGETIFISGAAGAVGGLVGMLAKQIFNCTVIGSCGGTDKCELIKSKYGFDHAIDYKTTPDAAALTAALKEVAPKGIDMYFENVGGMHFEAAFNSLRPYGRIAVCGGISQYNYAQALPVSFNPLQMIYSFQRIEGFVCFPWLSGKRGNFVKDMGAWFKEGKFYIQETTFDGIENWPVAFKSLFTGDNKGGKLVVRIQPSLTSSL